MPTHRALACLFISFAILTSACGGESSSGSGGSGTAGPGGSSTSGSGGSGTGGSGETTGSGGAMLQPKAPQPTSLFVRARPEEGELLSFALSGITANPDGTLVLAPDAAMETDPFPKGGFMGQNFYNGGTYRVGAAVSPDLEFPAGFDSVTPSFDADTPPGTWVEIKLSARISGTWSTEYNLGVWADDKSTVERHSVDNQADASGDVATDTLELKTKADALRIAVRLFSADPKVAPRLRMVSAVARGTSVAYADGAPDKSVWGTVLDVPQRSQMVFPDGGEVWCSPTSTSMITAYWSKKIDHPDLAQKVPDFQKGVYDWVYGGAGNWPFNTAHAASLDGGTLAGAVTRLPSFADVEALIKAQIPIAISVKTQSGSGHLIVIRGFDAKGDVVVNDPAFPSDAEVKATYDRTDLEVAWRHSDHTAYIVWPASEKPPVLPTGALY